MSQLVKVECNPNSKLVPFKDLKDKHVGMFFADEFRTLCMIVTEETERFPNTGTNYRCYKAIKVLSQEGFYISNMDWKCFPVTSVDIKFDVN